MIGNKQNKSAREQITSALKNKKILAAVISLLLIVIIIMIGVCTAGSSSEEITYRETTVQYGELVVGVTESGSVDIGTVDQVFELDMSALQRADTGNLSSGVSSSSAGVGGMSSGGQMGSAAGGAAGGGASVGASSGSLGGFSGGADMFSQIFNMTGAGENASTETIGNLTISEVCVSVGQQIQEGDILYQLEEDSVNELKEELEANVEKAKADLEAVYADQESSRLTAQYTYDSSIAYGSYAETEYNSAIKSLQDYMHHILKQSKEKSGIRKAECPQDPGAETAGIRHSPGDIRYCNGISGGFRSLPGRALCRDSGKMG